MATTIRMDVDTVTKKNSHENILDKFKNENIDILIGTQMVVKGHHFPNVTLVRSNSSGQQLKYRGLQSKRKNFCNTYTSSSEEQEEKVVMEE